MSNKLCSQAEIVEEIQGFLKDISSKQPEALLEKINQSFKYSDGVLLHKVKKHCSQRAGFPAGCLDDKGYINVRLSGRMHKAHRLIFAMHHGYMPNLVDHIDGNKSNNKIENLRDCSKSQNGMNRHHPSSSSTGHRNVYKKGAAFQVALRSDKKTIYVGSFVDIHKAISAAQEARAKHFGEFA
jgi:hypothetical protein